MLLLFGIRMSSYAQAEKKIRTTISVEFLSPMQDSVHLKILSMQDEQIPEQTVSGKPNKGRFVADLEITSVSACWISFGMNELKRPGYSAPIFEKIWIEPGDNLVLVIPNRESLLYRDVTANGKGSAKIDFFKYYYQSMEKYLKPFRKVNSPLLKDNYDETEFTHKMILIADSLRGKYIGKISPSFFATFSRSQIGEAHIQLSFGQILDEKAITDFIKFERLFPIANFINGGSLTLPVHMNSNLVYRALIAYNIKNGNKTYKSMMRNYSQVPSIIADYYKNPLLATRITSNYFLESIRMYGSLDSLFTHANLFVNKSDVNNLDVIRLKETLKSVGINQKTGAKAYPFELRNEKNELIKLSDFKGKVVLLDFMFNGCGGCKLMVPGMEQVEQNFEGRDVAFISISVDVDFERFKAAIGVYNTKHSLHLYTNGLGSTHDIIKHYNISAYPTIVLIDKNGNLITARAPRADSKQKELIGMIDKALEK